MRNGLKVLDTDCHQMEPAGMWAEYIDPKFADRAPARRDFNGTQLMVVEDEPITNQTGSYPMDAKEFRDATLRGMQRS